MDELYTTLAKVKKTHEVDESGDATLARYLEDLDLGGTDLDLKALNDFLKGYLIWANGNTDMPVEPD